MKATENTESTEKREKKTIFILTTRSFQSDTLFNPGNCQPVEFKKDTPWYKHAFPLYFTDIIHFLDLSAFQARVESYILQQLSLLTKETPNLDNEVERAREEHLKTYVKKEEKKKNKEIKKEIKKNKKNEKNEKNEKNNEEKNKGMTKEEKETLIETGRNNFVQNFQEVRAEISQDKDTLGNNVKEEIKRILEELKTKTLNNILINKREEKLKFILEKEILTRQYCYSTLQEVKENIVMDVATTTMIATLLKVIPSWWFALLKNKNKHCYLNYEDAYSCYTFMQEHASDLLEKCDNAHSKNNHNEFSLHKLLYKYSTDKINEDWYIVKCFGMRTDPDFGLTYILSLIKEIESYYPPASLLSFNILIHDYDIGRKLIHSSVGLICQNPKDILKKIKKSFAEKDIESTLENQQKIMLSPCHLENYYQNERLYLFLNAFNKLSLKHTNNPNNDRYKIIEYIKDNQESIKKIQRIIAFKHNKGEVAELLKTGFLFLLKYFIFHKQAILDMQYELIRKADNLTISYNQTKVKSLITTTELILNIIPKAEKALQIISKAEDALQIIPKAKEALQIISQIKKGLKTIAKAEKGLEIIQQAKEVVKKIPIVQEALQLNTTAINQKDQYITQEQNYLVKTKKNMTHLLTHLENIQKDNFRPQEIMSNINIINTFFLS